MKFSKFLTLFLLLAVFSSYSFAEESCLSDTEVSIKEVKKALSPILGNAKVVSVTTSPVEGLYEVIVEVNGRKLPVYLDCSLKYLISGEIISIKERKSLTRERIAKLNAEEVKKKLSKLERVIGKEKVEKFKKAIGERALSRVKFINISSIPKEGRVIFGNKNAKITVYVITDPECPFCKRLHSELKKVLSKRNDIKFEMILFPLPFHKYAKPVAKAIVCQKSNEDAKKLLDEAFKKQSDKKEFAKLGKKSCDKADEIISNNLNFGKKVKIGGTPTLIFPYGITISGALPANQIEKIIDALK
ncbi:MAG: DsbC family protein [Aquificota bacterium]|nr:MAG: DsbC family protein [Aquificota bacterium]